MIKKRPCIFFLSILSVIATPFSLRADNVDSLLYIEKLNEIKKRNILMEDYSSAIETAEVLANEGLFDEAVDILDKLVLFKSDKEEGSTPVAEEAKPKKRNITEIEFIGSYNRVVDVNERELTSVQRDSVNLSNRYLMGIGLKETWVMDRLGINSLKASLYFTNITIAPAIQIKASYFDSLLLFDNRFSVEKRLGKFYTVVDEGDTSGIGSDTIVNVSALQEYEWVNFKKDSSDLIANMFIGELSNRSRAKKLLFTMPLKWTFMYFRKNRPLFASRSIYSVNPYLEYRFSPLDIILSTNWYFEYDDYFHEGIALEGYPEAAYPAKVLDKIYNSPQLNLSWYVGKFFMELSQMLIWEYFPERSDILNHIHNKVNNGELDSINYELSENSRWWQSNARCSFRILPWFTAKLKGSFLYVKDYTILNQYYDLLTSIQLRRICDTTHILLTGMDVNISPELEFRLPNSLILGCEYIIEKRDAPIKGPFLVALISGSIRRASQNRYLWETYTAHEPNISAAYNPNVNINIKISQSLRYEDVVSDTSYSICSSYAPKTRWDMLFQFTPAVSLSCNGYVEIINYLTETLESGSRLVDKSRTNFSLSGDLNFKF